MHGVGGVIPVFAVQKFDGGNIDHALRVELLIRREGRVNGHFLSLGIADQGLDCLPAVQCLLEKILLPAGDAVIHAAVLHIQRHPVLRGIQHPILAVLGHCSPIPRGQLGVSQRPVSHFSDDPLLTPLPGVAALAGHILRISVRRDSPSGHRFRRSRGFF